MQTEKNINSDRSATTLRLTKEMRKDIRIIAALEDKTVHQTIV